ncbi:MAG: DUF5317 domain-containing protein [Acidimicrobiia bacterium]|nr:DUF5317 domain-containing protein [Acidimicrobiia bacterium]
MAWLAIVLLISVVMALVRGGRFLNLSEIKLRAWPLLVLGFGMQVAADRLDLTHDGAVTLVILSFIPLLIIAWLNRHEAGMWLVGLGVFMNFTVIALNSGMPVLPEAASIGLDRDITAIDFDALSKHVLMDSSTRLAFLGDVIPIRIIRNVVSLGDVFLAVGLGVYVEDQMRRPVRWFKHGLNESGAGSARRPTSVGS